MARGSGNPRRLPLPALALWIHQVESGLLLCERMKDEPSIHGLPWTQKMIAHYKRKLQAIMAHPPAGAQCVVRTFRKRLAKL